MNDNGNAVIGNIRLISVDQQRLQVRIQAYARNAQAQLDHLNSLQRVRQMNDFREIGDGLRGTLDWARQLEQRAATLMTPDEIQLANGYLNDEEQWLNKVHYRREALAFTDRVAATSKDVQYAPSAASPYEIDARSQFSAQEDRDLMIEGSSGWANNLLDSWLNDQVALKKNELEKARASLLKGKGVASHDSKGESKLSKKAEGKKAVKFGDEDGGPNADIKGMLDELSEARKLVRKQVKAEAALKLVFGETEGAQMIERLDMLRDDMTTLRESMYADEAQSQVAELRQRLDEILARSDEVLEQIGQQMESGKKQMKSGNNGKEDLWEGFSDVFDQTTEDTIEIAPLPPSKESVSKDKEKEVVKGKKQFRFNEEELEIDTPLGGTDIDRSKEKPALKTTRKDKPVKALADTPEPQPIGRDRGTRHPARLVQNFLRNRAIQKEWAENARSGSRMDSNISREDRQSLRDALQQRGLNYDNLHRRTAGVDQDNSGSLLHYNRDTNTLYVLRTEEGIMNIVQVPAERHGLTEQQMQARVDAALARRANGRSDVITVRTLSANKESKINRGR